MTAKARSDIRRKLRILNHARETGNVPKTCRLGNQQRSSKLFDDAQ